MKLKLCTSSRRKLWRHILQNHCGPLKCNLCQRPVDRNAPACSANQATLDHVIPLSRGGPNELSNLQVLCFPCNNRKDNKLPKNNRPLTAKLGELINK